MLNRPTHRNRFPHRVALAALAALLVVAGGVNGDDTELFRVESGKPYVFIVFDTSSSMNLSPGGGFVHASGDDPASIFYQAKEAVYEVFDDAFSENGDFIHYGLATYNQDGLRVRGKHWLYKATALPSTLTIGNTTYPSVGELWTFGQHLPTNASLDPATLPIPAVGQLGTCASPVDLTQNREAINRFAKLSPTDSNSDGYVDGMQTTTIWLEQQNTTYKLEVSKHSGSSTNHLLGETLLKAKLELSEANSSCTNLTEVASVTTDFELQRPFLMHDMTDVEVPNSENDEMEAGLWDYRDAEATATCGDSQQPFTGEGWEGNYDGGTFVGDPDDYPVVDPFCVGDDCYSLKQPTDLFPETTPAYNRCYDSGDMIPFDWDDTYREKMFTRMAPNWTPATERPNLDFGVASYFKDVPNEDGFLELINPNRKPLVAYGASPVGKALNDWRCFYLGNNYSGGKCRNNEQPFGEGFDDLAAAHDLEWGCRKPFIIVIGDGENNCGGEDPTAETANLRRNGVKVWVINFGGPLSKKLRTLAQNTGGEYVAAENKGELTDALQVILGEIIEQTKSFASAVVPTVQAEEDDKVFISNFKPLNTATVWPGNVLSFLKPVPVHGDGTPDTSTVCADDPDASPASECFLWNAGDEMLDQVQEINVQFGTLPTQRRIYYSLLGDSGEWPSNRRYFAPTNSGMADSIRYDMWRGMEIVSSTTPDGDLSEEAEETHETTANTAVTEMMAIKADPNGTPNDDSDDLPFILGDIFHSNPLLLGAPPNTLYFALDVEGDGLTCDAGSKSYRCFFRKHQNRRKLLMVGSSDGMVHAIDTGIYRTTGAFADRFDRGTGKEVFGFVPRSVMPKIKDLYADGQNRQWLVDGTLVGADVFIDPLADGGAFPEEGDREWRTVAISGLREGGRGYFALDVTQPDEYDSEGRPTGITDYVPSCADGGGDCGTLPYPAELWEFVDGVFVDDPPRLIPFDKDNDGFADLADGWSTPNIGRVRVCAGLDCDPNSPANDLEDRYVAVIGGGFDKTSATGDWLYMIDIETGKSIYKQRLVDTDGVSTGGSAPAEPAAVDTDGDGYLDRIYIGTTEGFLFRADLRGPNGEIPALTGGFEIANPEGAPMLVPVEQIEGLDYRPRVIFKAQPTASTSGPDSHAFYYPPSVVYSAQLGDYVLAIGTGDRHDLWTSDSAPGHFYMFRDDIDIGDDSTFYTEEDLVAIDTNIEGEQTGDLLTDATLLTKGWYLILRNDERLISDPFVVSGVVIFNVYEPDVVVDEDALTCSRTGTSRIFAVKATNGNGLLFSAGTRTRWIEVADFVTQPYVEQALTKNPELEEGGLTADDLTEDLWKVAEEIKSLFPSNCRFTNQRLDIKTLSSDTGIHTIAPVPVCVIQKNWKDW